MDNSWFSKTTSKRSSFLSSPSHHELPRWRSPSPMAASIIPPPIVQSTYAPTAPDVAIRSTIIEKPSPLQDRQSELEADLQFLLDAQAEGLLRGLEGGAVPDDHASTGSTTPTAQSVRSASARRSARPPRRKPGLRSARKGIYNSILALSAVKDEELQEISASAQEKESTLAQIDDWEHKRAGLQDATKSLDASEETVRAQRLRQEADVLQEDINAVELQLSDMKSRHRKLMRQVAAVENAVQARLASYESSLNMLEADVKKFLSLKPVDREPSRPSSSNGKTSVWNIPAKRRTLDMAREQWTEERDQVLQQKQSVEYEKVALDEGAAVWKDVVVQVTDFEKKLRAEMSTLSMSSSQSAWDESPPRQQTTDNNERLKELLAQLDVALSSLQEKHNLAESCNWNLLIAAIGAELDALRQGKTILQSVLGVTAQPSAELLSTEDEAQAHTNGSPGVQNDLHDHDGNEIHELDRSFETARPAVNSKRKDFDSDTDDPDPELLFSRQDVSSED